MDEGDIWTIEDDIDAMVASDAASQLRLSPAEMLKQLGDANISVEGLSEKQIENLFARQFPEAFKRLERGSDADACASALNSLTGGEDTEVGDTSQQGTLLGDDRKNGRKKRRRI